MTTAHALLPCPFCGDVADTEHGQYGVGTEDERWWICCVECQACTWHFDTEAEAITAWNRRAELEEMRAQRDAWAAQFRELAQIHGCNIRLTREGNQHVFERARFAESCIRAEYASRAEKPAAGDEVERLAKVLWKIADDRWFEVEGGGIKVWQDMARAAIAAIRTAGAGDKP